MNIVQKVILGVVAISASFGIGYFVGNHNGEDKVIGELQKRKDMYNEINQYNTLNRKVDVIVNNRIDYLNDLIDQYNGEVARKTIKDVYRNELFEYMRLGDTTYTYRDHEKWMRENDLYSN